MALLGQDTEAVAAWTEAAESCRGWDHRDRLCSILERLIALYGAGRKVGEQRMCDAELRAARAGAPLVRKASPPVGPARPDAATGAKDAMA